MKLSGNMQRNNGGSQVSITDLSTIYAPERGEAMVEAGEDRIYSQESPTLRQVRDNLGDNALNAWLTGQISYMFEHTDVRMDRNKTESITRLIRAKYPWIRLAEFMHFVFLFRTGEFGKIYGKADGQTVMLALKDYCKIREESLARLRKDKEQTEPEYESRITPSGISATLLKAMEDNPQGEWRKEPWGTMLSQWYNCKELPRLRASGYPIRELIAEEERRFPGNWTYEQRKRFAERLGYNDA